MSGNQVHSSAYNLNNLKTVPAARVLKFLYQNNTVLCENYIFGGKEISLSCNRIHCCQLKKNYHPSRRQVTWVCLGCIKYSLFGKARRCGYASTWVWPSPLEPYSPCPAVYIVVRSGEWWLLFPLFS